MIIIGLGFRTCIIRQIRILQRALWEKHMNIEGKMENSYKYFKNKNCKYFPCHKGLSDDFNCLFCYCPMYSMPNCPGSKTYIEKNGKKIKVCTDCTFPHRPENYDKIIQILIRNNNNWFMDFSRSDVPNLWVWQFRCGCFESLFWYSQRLWLMIYEIEVSEQADSDLRGIFEWL